MAISFDVNKVLKGKIDTLIDSATNPICNTLAISYNILVKQVNTIVTPVAFFKNQIISSMDSVTEDILNDVSKSLTLLSSNIPNVNLTIDSKTLKELNIMKKTCLDFNDIIPNPMKNLISNTMNDINDISKNTFGEFGEFLDVSFTDFPEMKLPSEMQDMFDDSVDFFKDNALSDLLSEGTKAILTPLTMYRDFIKSSGVVDLLKRMQKFEKCMTNPNGQCKRPKKEFMFPGTKKYNSQYYMDLLAINPKGEVLLKKITGQTRNIETKMSKTMTNLDVFKKPIIGK